MQYTLKRVIDVHPEWIERLKQQCYAINGCLSMVHKDLGPFLNEYIYQDALQILLEERQIPYQKEYCFHVQYRGKQIGVLYNFQPIKDQSEHYYLDTDGTMYMF